MPTTATPAALRDYVRRHGSDFLADPNITSIGIGHKVVDGRRTDVVCVQFTVAAKVPPEQVEALGSALIPSSVEVESTAVPTDVLERVYAPSYVVVPEAAPDARRTRVDPVVPGVSVAGVAESAGTLGCIVWDTDTGAPHVLSNWHVLQGPGGGIGDEVLQPGPYDDNRVGRNRLGVVTRSYLGIAGDAAIATIEDRGFDPTVLDLGVAPTELGEPELDDPVVKSGRTTAVTHGRVSRVDVIVRLDYGEAGEHQVGCFEIRPGPRAPARGRRAQRRRRLGQRLALQGRQRPSDPGPGRAALRGRDRRARLRGARAGLPAPLGLRQARHHPLRGGGRGGGGEGGRATTRTSCRPRSRSRRSPPTWWTTRSRSTATRWSPTRTSRSP